MLAFFDAFLHCKPKEQTSIPFCQKLLFSQSLDQCILKSSSLGRGNLSSTSSAVN